MTSGAEPAPVGWNTWDVRFHTGAAHLPTGLRVRFALAGPDGEVFDGFTWRHGLVRLGHHTVDGTYAQVTVTAFDTTLDIQLAGGATDVLDAIVSVGSGSSSGVEAADLVIIIDRMPGIRGDDDEAGPVPFELSSPAFAAVTVNIGDPYRMTVPATEAAPLRLRLAPVGISPAETSPAENGAGGTGTGDGRDLEPNRVEAARTESLGRRLRTGGRLGDAGDAYVRSVTWNTIHAPDIGRVLTPTSRDFVSAEREGFYGSWAVHVWDTFFTGLVASWIDPSYARGIFRQILDQADHSGMLPNRVSDDRGRTDDRSQSPVGGITVLKAYLGSGLSDTTRDRTLLADCYDDLRRWHLWWPSARRGPFGLLAWGSDPVPGDPDAANREILIDRTKREGLDDSPMYDEVEYDWSTHTQNLADVGLNALHIADADAVAAIADLLGDTPVAKELRDRDDTARAETDRILWIPTTANTATAGPAARSPSTLRRPCSIPCWAAYRPASRLAIWCPGCSPPMCSAAARRCRAWLGTIRDSPPDIGVGGSGRRARMSGRWTSARTA